MKLGAEPKKIAILGGLLCVAAYFYISGSGSDAPPTPAPSKAPVARPSTPALPPANIERPAVRPRPKTAVGGRDFRPRLGGRDAVADPTTIDPTLRLDLLAKVQDVRIEGAARNLFQFGAAPAPKAPEVKVVPKPLVATAQAPATPVVSGPPPKPAPPAIPLKFYGYVSKNRAGDKRAFFLEGEDIFVAAEGETIKQRYKVVRIGINSAVVEDTQFSHQQTLPLEEQAG